MISIITYSSHLRIICELLAGLPLLNEEYVNNEHEIVDSVLVVIVKCNEQFAGD